jgi:Tol biopolymer transport system component
LRHGRRVALKVLKPELAALLGRDRFLAEIRTTAGLQHPHILPLFDSGEADGFLFYVMPFVEGETLRGRLDRERQLPVDEALQVTRLVAEALEHAHRHGVVHRDIKPANILLLDGKPLLSDFGIALALGVAGGSRLTESGLSIGTPQYMSPEQATGDASVGAATDLFALGCVLYEMLVGEAPFTGNTTQAILGKILTAEPVSATRLRRSVPVHVDVAIRKALEKLPADRFRSVIDFAHALDDPDFRDGDATHATDSARGGSHGSATWRRVAIGLAAAIVIIALSGAWAASTLLRRESGTVARFDITPTGARRLSPSSGSVDVAIAPDGARIVYVGLQGVGESRLWQRRLDSLDASPLAGTEGARAPDISPDGRSVAFVAHGALKTMSLDGGPAVTVAPRGDAPSWGEAGTLYFGLDGVIHRIQATGGDPATVTKRADNTRHGFPDVLPDGRGLLLTVLIGPPAQSRIAVVGPDGGEPREILAGTMARYSTTGHIVYATSGGTMMAAPFDLRRLEVTGPSVALFQGVAVDITSATQFAMSASGTFVYRTGGRPLTELVWVDRGGKAAAVDSTWTRDLGSPALSPDGTHATVAVQGEASMDVWVKRLDRGPGVRLTAEGSRSDYPSWAPDGQSVSYTSNRAGPLFDLWTRRADASAPAALLLDQERALAEALWSPDGRWLIYRTSSNERGAGDILAVRPGGNAPPVPLATSGFMELAPAISPDGRWLAYSSNETGRSEIFVVPFPDAGAAKWPVSDGGGTEPAWSRDGRELFYRSGAGDLVAVRVGEQGSFSVGTSTTLFSAAQYASTSVHRQYDVAPDGRRFLMIRPLYREGVNQLVLVQHFATDLVARVTR